MLLKLLLLAGFFNGLVWVLVIPIWQYPDEQAHFAQVQDVAELGYVPVSGPDTSLEISLLESLLGTKRDKLGNNKFTYHPEYRIDFSEDYYGPGEKVLISAPKKYRTTMVKKEATHNPFLYYYGASFFYKLAGNSSIFNRIYLVRFFSIIIYLLNIFVAYIIGKEIYNKNKLFPISLASMLAFVPMLVFSSTGVLPDTLTNVLFSLSLLLSLKIFNSQIKVKHLLLSIFIIMLGYLTRQQFIIAAPILLTAYFWKLQRKKSTFILIALTTCILVLLPLIIDRFFTSTPFLAEFRIPDIGIFNTKHVSPQTIISFTKFSLRTYYDQTLPWYFGVYRWLSLTLPLNYYRIIKVLIVLSVLGFFASLYKAIKIKKLNIVHKDYLFIAVSCLIYFAVFYVGDYFFFASNGYSFGIQGRYFFPLIVAHIILFIAGLWALAKIVAGTSAKYLLFALIMLVIVFNDLSLFHVTKSYYSTIEMGRFISQLSQYKPVVFKGNTIPLIVLLSFISQLLFVLTFFKHIIRTSENN